MTQDQRKIWLLVGILAVLFAPVVLVALGLLWVVVMPRGYIRKAEAFHQDVQHSISEAQLRDWALDEIAAASGGRVEVSATPDFLNATRSGPPSYVVVEPGDSTHQPYVHVYWGGGFGHWGLKVGSTSFRAVDDARNHHIEWKPGLYVWHEIQ